MNKYDSDLKTQFSAYVKQSVLNAKGHYLKKKCRIECIETSYADGLIVPGQNTEDLLREIELLSGKIFNGITEIRILNRGCTAISCDYYLDGRTEKGNFAPYILRKNIPGNWKDSGDV